MKAIATSVAILTGVSKAAEGGENARQRDGRDEKQGERIGGEAEQGGAHDGRNMPRDRAHSE